MKIYMLEIVKKAECGNVELPIIRVTYRNFFNKEIQKDIIKDLHIDGVWRFMESGQLVCPSLFDSINTFYISGLDAYVVNKTLKLSK